MLTTVVAKILQSELRTKKNKATKRSAKGEQVCAKLYQLEQVCARLYQLEQGDKGGTAWRHLRRMRSLFRPSRSPQTTPASAQTDENYRRTSSACRPPGKRGPVACCCSITSIIKKISFDPALGMGVLKTLEQWCCIVNVCLHLFFGVSLIF